MSQKKTPSPEFTLDEILEEAEQLRASRRKTEKNKAPLPDPDDDQVRIYVPSSSEKSVTADGDTRVLPSVKKRPPSQETVRIVLSNGESEQIRVAEPAAKSSRSKAAVDAEDELMRNQVTWDELVAENSPEPEEEPEDEQTLEERLRAVRKEQIRDFSFQREKEYNGFKFSGEEEENEPEEEPEEFREEVLEDYCNPEEKTTVLHELQYRRRTGWFSFTVTAVFELVILWMLAMFRFSNALGLDTAVFVTLNVLFLVAMLALGHRTVSKGVSDLLHRRGGVDSAVSLVAIVSLLHTVAQYFYLDQLDATTPVLASVGGLALLIGAVGRQLRFSRMCAGFRFMDKSDLYAAHFIENEQTAAEVGRAAVSVGMPRVAYYKKAGFLTRFLELSYAEDPLDRLMGVFLPGISAAALVLSAVYGLIHADFFRAITVFACVMCLSVPASTALALALPFTRASKRLLRHGGLITGWPAVEQFGRIQALTVDAEQIFPGEYVALHGIKTFAGSAVDDVILDAAAVSIRAGGPLSHVFRRVIEDKVDILREVDTLVYEQGMGLSGWVAGRRVLVGNRRLMINHGVDVPSKDYEDRYCHSGRQLVYLSVGGALSGMFIVSYLADPGVSEALRELSRRGVTLLVRSSDPNVTEELICDVFRISPYSVELLNASAGRTYDQLVMTPDDRYSSALASNGKLEGSVHGIAVCRRLNGAGRMMLVLQALLGIMGFILGAVVAFIAPAQQWGLFTLYILAYLLGACIITALLPLLTRRS